MSPEEYAARYAHTIGASSFDDYAYQDQTLHTWIHRLHEILRAPDAIDAIAQYRLQYLTPEERAWVEEDEKEF